MNSIDRDSAATILHQYSEWLDGEGYMGTPGPEDTGTHDELVAAFLEQRTETWLPRVGDPEPPSPVAGAQVGGQVQVGCNHPRYGGGVHCAEMSCSNYVRKHEPVEPLVARGYNGDDGREAPEWTL